MASPRRRPDRERIATHSAHARESGRPVLGQSAGSPLPRGRAEKDGWEERMLRFALAAAAALFAGAALAQPAVQPPMAVPPLIDWAKVQIKVTDLGNKTYMLEGAG